MELIYTEHAKKRMAQRKIASEDVEKVVYDSEFTEEQVDGCIRYYRFIDGLGYYVRVVCRDKLVITVMPDRSVKRRKR